MKIILCWLYNFVQRSESFYLLFFFFFFFWMAQDQMCFYRADVCFCIYVVRLQPPTQNIPMVPGGMNQSGPPPQPPHGHNIPSEGMVSGGPPAPHMPNQMNGQMPGKWTLPPKFLFLVFLSLVFLLFPQSLPHLGCLATPQNCEGGRSAEGWCHPSTGSGGPGLILCLIMVFFSHRGLFNWALIAVPHNNCKFVMVNVEGSILEVLPCRAILLELHWNVTTGNKKYYGITNIGAFRIFSYWCEKATYPHSMAVNPIIDIWSPRSS